MIVSPAARPNWAAMREPIKTPCPVAKPTISPDRILDETTESLVRSSGRIPRTSAPVPAPSRPEASVWPSTKGNAMVTPGTAAKRSARPA